jgi:hypothetical protein
MGEEAADGPDCAALGRFYDEPVRRRLFANVLRPHLLFKRPSRRGAPQTRSQPAAARSSPAWAWI